MSRSTASPSTSSTQCSLSRAAFARCAANRKGVSARMANGLHYRLTIATAMVGFERSSAISVITLLAFSKARCALRGTHISPLTRKEAKRDGESREFYGTRDGVWSTNSNGPSLIASDNDTVEDPNTAEMERVKALQDSLYSDIQNTLRDARPE